MRKFAAIMLVAVLALLVFTGCNSGQNDTSQEWAVEVIESDGLATEIDSSEIGDIEIVEIEAVLEKKDGSKIAQKWEGIRVADLLEEAGIGDYNIVEVEASDGYLKEFSAETINDSGTILGLVEDGKKLTEEEGLPRLVVKTMPGSSWIKNVAKIRAIE